MRQFILAMAACAAVLALTGQAQARDWYVKAEIGTTLDNQVETGFGGVELTDGPVYGAYIGTAVGPVRVEAGAAHISGDIDLGFVAFDASAIDYNATAYLDTASGFYVGAGVNYIDAEVNLGFASVEQSGWGYHASGGYAFEAAGGIVELQASWLEADLDDVDLSGPRATIGYRRAL